MLEDFDSLRGNIQKYCTFIPLLEKRTSISVKGKLNKLKKQIRTETTIEEFADLVRQELNILNDGHTEIANSSRVKWWVMSHYNYLKEVAILFYPIYCGRIIITVAPKIVFLPFPKAESEQNR